MQADIRKMTIDKDPPKINIRRSTQWGPTLLASIEVNGQPVQATVDTGATVTILSQQLYERLGVPEGEDSFKVRLSNAEDGQDMDAIGGVMVKIRMGSCTVDWNVYVAPIRDDVLLGLDFLRAADVTIRARGALYIGAQKVGSQLVSHAATYRRYPVRLEGTALLDPRTEYILWGGNAEPRPHHQGMIEPNTLLEGVCVAATLVQLDSRVPIRVANFTDKQIRLRSGILLGDIVEVVMEEDSHGQTKGPRVARRTTPAPRAQMPEHLLELEARAIKELEGNEKTSVAKLLMAYEDIFAKDDMDLGNFTHISHHIDTGDARPIRQPPRRTPLEFQAEEEGHLKKMLEAGIITPSKSEWASPVVLVRKKDGGVRWCVDY